MSKKERPTDGILSRFIGEENEVTELLKDIEQALGIKIYPSRPRPDYDFPHLVRVYVDFPIDRRKPRDRKEAKADE